MSTITNSQEQWFGGHHTCTISPLNNNTSHFDTCRYVYLKVSFTESTMDVRQVAFVSHDGERVQDHPLHTGDKLKRRYTEIPFTLF